MRIARRTVIGATVVAMVLGAVPAHAAGGQLDPSFGGDGTVMTNFTPAFDAASSIAVQADGKLVVGGVSGETGPGAGDAMFALARYNADGTLDPTFDGDGRVVTNLTEWFDGVTYVAIQSDGKIVAVGLAGLSFPEQRFDTQAAIARYDVDGSLDETFGDGGTVLVDLSDTADGATAVAIQADGRIVASGISDYASSAPSFAVLRFETGGSLDPTFGDDGIVTTRIRRGSAGYGVAIAADGRIVVAGDAFAGRANSMFAVARYEPDGTLDTTFGGDGTVTVDVTTTWDPVNAVAVQADGRILVSGGAGDDRIGVVRFAPGGSLDPTFGGDGIVRTDVTRYRDRAEEGLLIQPDGRIVVVGFAGVDGPDPAFAVVRYHPDGTLDPTFGGDGRVRTNFTPRSDGAIGAALQTDGKIVVVGNAGEHGEGAGNARFAIARYLAT